MNTKEFDLVIFGEPYAEYGSEKDNSSLKPTYTTEWYVNDSDQIYFGGLHYRDILKKYQWLKISDLKSTNINKYGSSL